ncbi:MAG TPA: response regulator [Terriglobales bacterium]
MAEKPSLLIVDDEAGVLFTLHLVFQDAGYVVTTADSEAQAIQVLRKPGEFDAILTDMSMENDQSGLAVARAAAQLRPRPVIIIFTGFGTAENETGALENAADHFAMKPIDIDDFKNVLARLLSLRSDRLAARGGR